MQNAKQTSGIDPKKYYSVAEAANIIGIHRCTLWRWVNTLRISCKVRVVNHRKEFLGADLLKLMKRI